MARKTRAMAAKNGSLPLGEDLPTAPPKKQRKKKAATNANSPEASKANTPSNLKINFRGKSAPKPLPKTPVESEDDFADLSSFANADTPSLGELMDGAKADANLEACGKAPDNGPLLQSDAATNIESEPISEKTVLPGNGTSSNVPLAPLESCEEASSNPPLAEHHGNPATLGEESNNPPPDATAAGDMSAISAILDDFDATFYTQSYTAGGLYEAAENPEAVVEATQQSTNPAEIKINNNSSKSVATAFGLSLAEFRKVFTEYEGLIGQQFRAVWETWHVNFLEPWRKNIGAGGKATTRMSDFGTSYETYLRDLEEDNVFGDPDLDAYTDRSEWDQLSWNAWFLGRTMRILYAKKNSMLSREPRNAAALKVWSLKCLLTKETSPTRIMRTRKAKPQPETAATLSRKIQKELTSAAIQSNPHLKPKPKKPQSAPDASASPAKPGPTKAAPKRRLAEISDSLKNGLLISSRTNGDWERIAQEAVQLGFIEEDDYEPIDILEQDLELTTENRQYLTNLRDHDPYELSSEVVINTSVMDVDSLEDMAKHCPLIVDKVLKITASELVNLADYSSFTGATKKLLRTCLCRYHAFRAIEALTAGSFDPNHVAENMKKFLSHTSRPVNDTLDAMAKMDAEDIGALDDDFDEDFTAIQNEKQRSANERLVKYHGNAEKLKEGAKRIRIADHVLGGVQYSAEELVYACATLRIAKLTKLQQPFCNSNIFLKWWQAIVSAAIWDDYLSGSKGKVLSDLVGLGKTFSMLSVLLKYLQHQLTLAVAASKSADPKVRETAESLLPKPVLICVPTTLISQWEAEIRRFSNALDVHVYHGDGRHKEANALRKAIQSTLLSTQAWRFRFKVPEKGKDVKLTVFLTGHETFRGRHGRNAYRDHVKIPALADVEHPDPKQEWDADLAGKFDFVIVDEAHCARNEETLTNTALLWTKPKYFLLATATPIWHDFHDLSGLLKLLQAPGATQRVKDFGKDPFDLPDSDSRKREFCLTVYAWETFACSEEARSRMVENARGLASDYPAAAGPPTLRNGVAKPGRNSATIVATAMADRLKYVWGHICIRRDYTCAMPAGSTNTIGSTLPPRRSYTVTMDMDEMTKELHEVACQEPRKNLLMVTSSSAGKDKRLPNGNKVRALVLNSTNPSLFYAEHIGVAHDVYMESIRRIDERVAKSVALCLQTSPFYAMILKGFGCKPPHEGLPADAHVTAQYMVWLFQFSLKLKIFFAIIADQVLRRQERAIVWVHYPAMQKLLTSMLVAFGMKARAFLSTLDPRERQQLVSDFTTKPTADTPAARIVDVLVCSYLCSPAGYNMEGNCRYVHKFDTAPNASIDKQALGRTYRIGQTGEVEEIFYIVGNTFQNAMQVMADSHSVFQTMAEVDMDRLVESLSWTGMPQEANDQIREYEGLWLVDGRLFHADHPDYAKAKETAYDADAHVQLLDRLGVGHYLQGVYKGDFVKVGDHLHRDEVDVEGDGKFKPVARNFQLDEAAMVEIKNWSRIVAKSNESTDRERRRVAGTWVPYGDSADVPQSEQEEIAAETNDYIAALMTTVPKDMTAEQRKGIEAAIERIKTNAKKTNVRLVPPTPKKTPRKSRKSKTAAVASESDVPSSPATPSSPAAKRGARRDNDSDGSDRGPSRKRQKTNVQPAALDSVDNTFAEPAGEDFDGEVVQSGRKKRKQAEPSAKSRSSKKYKSAAFVIEDSEDNNDGEEVSAELANE